MREIEPLTSTELSTRRFIINPPPISVDLPLSLLVLAPTTSGFTVVTDFIFVGLSTFFHSTCPYPISPSLFSTVLFCTFHLFFLCSSPFFPTHSPFYFPSTLLQSNISLTAVPSKPQTPFFFLLCPLFLFFPCSFQSGGVLFLFDFLSHFNTGIWFWSDV